MSIAGLKRSRRSCVVSVYAPFAPLAPLDPLATQDRRRSRRADRFRATSRQSWHTCTSPDTTPIFSLPTSLKRRRVQVHRSCRPGVTLRPRLTPRWLLFHAIHTYFRPDNILRQRDMHITLQAETVLNWQITQAEQWQCCMWSMDRWDITYTALGYRGAAYKIYISYSLGIVWRDEKRHFR